VRTTSKDLTPHPQKQRGAVIGAAVALMLVVGAAAAFGLVSFTEGVSVAPAYARAMTFEPRREVAPPPPATTKEPEPAPAPKAKGTWKKPGKPAEDHDDVGF
jgi:hypothetical protein